MQNRRLIAFLVYAALVIIHSGAAIAEQITIGILNNSSTQRSFYTTFAREFERNNPGTTVRVDFKSDSEFKASLSTWFATGEGPDLLNWQGGERLYQYVRSGSVVKLSDIWQQQNLHDNFSAGSAGAVTYKDEQYGIPVSYYQWGFYYRQSVFEQLNLRPPQTWDDFLYVCSKLKQNGIAPITIGAKYKWPSAAWFDYLNLRINGLEFHQQLLKGAISFQDPRVRKVFEHWKQLVDGGYFVPQLNRWTWGEAMPFMYHKMAGVTLIGNFFTGSLPDTLREDFRFFRFPVIDRDMPIYEEAPLDLFMLPSYSRNKALAKKFLRAIAGVQFQEKFNDVVGMISPNTNSQPSNDYFIRAGSQALGKAEGLSQFFDRDTNSGMATAAMEVFTSFMGDGNIDQALYQLEQARQQHLL